MGSSLLEQQELIEAPPPRRLIVPTGHSAWWGVDPGTRRTAVAGVSRVFDGSLDRWVKTISYAPAEGAQRLEAIRRETYRWIGSLVSVHGPPGVVFVEQPSGKQENPALSYTVGVVIEAVFAGVQSVTGRSPAVETVSSSRWKKVACGRGNIYKPRRASEGDYGVLSWAQANGYEGSSWDEADATGVAECARRSVMLDER